MRRTQRDAVVLLVAASAMCAVMFLPVALGAAPNSPWRYVISAGSGASSWSPCGRGG